MLVTVSLLQGSPQPYQQLYQRDRMYSIASLVL